MKNNIKRFDIQLFKNFASLSALKTSNFFLSWLIYPYIIRQVGVVNFGEIVLTQSIMLYFVVFTDYGFNLSAPREIARLYPHKPQECYIKASNFLQAQILLCCLSFIVLIPLSQTVPFFSKRTTLLYLSFMIVVGQNALPAWVFQGIEKMEYLALLNLIAKLLYITGIWWILQVPENYLWVNFIWGAAHLLVGFIAWGILIVRFGFKIRFISWTKILRILKQDFHLFIANLTNMIIFNSSVIILGVFANATTLGLYSIADRIFLFARQIVVVVHQTIYPRATQLADKSRQELQRFFHSFIRWVLVIMLPACLLLLLLAPWVVFIFAEKHLTDTTNFVKILSFTSLLALLNIPASQSLLVLKKEKVYTQLSALAVAFYALMSLILIYFYQGYGAAWAMLITESFLLLVFNIYYFRMLYRVSPK